MIVDCALYVEGARKGGRLDLDEAVGEAGTRADAFVWVGLYEPSADELVGLAREFDLHPLAVEDAVHAHQRPKLERYGETLFIVLKTGTYVDRDEVVSLGEVMLFVGRSFVVSVRHGTHGELGDLRTQLESDPERLRCGPAAVMHAVLDHVVDGYETVLAGLDVDVDEIEEQVFSGGMRDHSQRVYKLKREVIEFRRAVLPLITPVGQLADGTVTDVAHELAEWFRDVHDHLLRVADHLESQNSLLDSVLAANAAQVAHRQNEDMRKISAWVAIAAVPTMVAGIYGMNFDHMPELRWRYGYPLVLVVLVAACYSLWRYFKRQGWL